MPRTIGQGFNDFLGRLTPTKTESSAAKSHRSSIEACLKNNFGMLRFFRSGSFGNGTSIAGCSDVDYFASIPTKNLKADSDITLSQLKTALDIRFPNTGVRIDSPAVVVPFGSTVEETTEIVPADYVYKNSDNFHVYDMPDSYGGWKKASPEAHKNYVESIDDKLGSKVRPLIRFIKAWKYYNSVPMSSFYIEMFVAMFASNESSIVYSYDIKSIFKELFNTGLTSITDPLGISGLIHAGSMQNDINNSYIKVETASTNAQKALDEERAGNISNAFDYWDKVFDNNFPSYYY